MNLYSHPHSPLPLPLHSPLRPPAIHTTRPHPLGADCYVKKRPPVIPPGLPAEHDRIVPAVRT